jgi:hypothetical protein
MENQMKIDVSDIHPDSKMMFISMAKAVSLGIENGLTKEKMLEFCADMWEEAQSDGIEKFNMKMIELQTYIHKKPPLEKE